MKKVFIVAFLALLIFSCENNHKKLPVAKNGVLDLRNWDFEKDGIVRLDGEWEFYWHEFLTAKDFDSVQNKAFIKVPDVWKGYYWQGIKLPGTGATSYKLKIITNPYSKRNDFAIKINNMGTAYRLYINDSLTGGNGQVGKSSKTSVPQSIPKIYLFYTNEDTITLVANVSNFHYRKGGIWYSINFGLPNDIIQLRETLLTSDLLQIGAMILLAMYLLLLFFYRKKEIPTLILGLGLIFALIRISSTNELFITNLFPSISFELLVKCELSSLYLAFVSMILYVHILFRDVSSKPISNLFIFIFLLITIICLFLPASYSSEFVPYALYFCFFGVIHGIVICIKAINKQQFDGVIIIIGYVLGLFTAINDFLFLNYLINTMQIAPYAFLILNIGQVIVLSRKFAREYSRIENFSQEMEITVIERTKELSIEKNKSEKLLLNVLPESIANRLKDGETPIADHFDEASILFIDIADFTKMSAKSNPQTMVRELNKIFTIFDKISAKFGLEKIKTIGDCYMAAAGIPEPRQDHAEAIAGMALEVMNVMDGYKTDDGYDIRFRIGLDCGPIVAGVIGEQKFIYDLWGDPVNTASRMEYFGVVGRIQCTERFKDVLHLADVGHLFTFEERGEIEIKGKGMMRTYFLT
ncbi:MAG: adenylate/guanylate cyclase [Ignavibacteria bacterium]|nr:adenylate/guanylate cyclase [Ignavibacteria bacterium]